VSNISQHASWVSDLVWLGSKDYDPVEGTNSVGVEFAGSAVTSPCPYGANITLAQAHNYTNWIVGANPEVVRTLFPAFET
jgi:alkaline phosphatase D